MVKLDLAKYLFKEGLMIDSHTHGHYSYDSKADYNEMIKSAINNGLKGICFTDHYEYVPTCIDLGHKQEYETGKFYGFSLNNYIKDIKELASTYSQQNFKVLVGLEAGLYDTNMENVANAMNSPELQGQFDAIIGSVHYVPNAPDPFYHEYTQYYDKNTAYSKALEQYIKLLPQYPKINILGHFDYVARYSQTYTDRNMYYNDFPDHFDKLFNIIISMGIALEINTATYVKRDEYPANKLDINILKRYRELGGELITIGSDAHYTQNVARGFDEMRLFLKNAGFAYLTHFENGKPIMTGV